MHHLKKPEHALDRVESIRPAPCRYLQNTFLRLRNDFSGIVPTTVDDLITLPGVGRKTAILVLNKAYGFFSGIGTDIHVCNVAGALGLAGVTDPLHVEASLSQWIPQNSFKKANTIFGSFAQLFTQDLAAIKAEDDKKKLNIVLQAILQ